MVLYLVFEHVDQDLNSFIERCPAPGLGPDRIKVGSKNGTVGQQQYCKQVFLSWNCLIFIEIFLSCIDPHHFCFMHFSRKKCSFWLGSRNIGLRSWSIRKKLDPSVFGFAVYRYWYSTYGRHSLFNLSTITSFHTCELRYQALTLIDNRTDNGKMKILLKYSRFFHSYSYMSFSFTTAEQTVKSTFEFTGSIYLHSHAPQKQACFPRPQSI